MILKLWVLNSLSLTNKIEHSKLKLKGNVHKTPTIALIFTQGVILIQSPIKSKQGKKSN